MTVTVDIDQFTVVLLPNQQAKHAYQTLDRWEKWCQDIITNITQQTQLETLFGVMVKDATTAPAGYNSVHSFSDVPFYLAFAYHSKQPDLGLIIKFSAHAWMEYRQHYHEAFGESIHLNRFLQLLQSDYYTVRLSRVDFCCDFIDEGIDIDKLKRSIEEKRVEVRYGKYRTRPSNKRK